MKTTDRMLQRWRILKAKRFIPPGARLLDIGCYHGEIFKVLSRHGIQGVGIDPLLEVSSDQKSCTLISGIFPRNLPDDVGKFDVITVLAVLEHIAPDMRVEFARACADLLKSDGRIILTVPSQITDVVLTILLSLHIIDGMSLEQHQGFDPEEVPRLFGGVGMNLEAWEKFQFGLNNLFVFTN